MDAGNVLFIDVIPDFGGGFLVNKRPYLLIPFPCIPGLLRNPCRIFFQNIAQPAGQVDNIRLGPL